MHFLLDNLPSIWDNKDNGERLLEQEPPVRAYATASLSHERFQMFDKDGNYFPNDEEAIEFEEFDMEDE